MSFNYNCRKRCRKRIWLGNYKRDNLIFDYDIIHILSKLLNCSEKWQTNIEEIIVKTKVIVSKIIVIYLVDNLRTQLKKFK